MKKTIWSFFIDNYRLTYVLVAGIVLFGLISTLQIPKESSPEISIPIFVVSTSLPGAAAEDVEELITDIIEDRLQSLPDIDSITSTSQQGFSQIVVSFNVEADADEKSMDLSERLNNISSSLPDDASIPVTQQVSFNDVPIATFAISGPYERHELKEFAELLKEEIDGIQDVSQVNVIGAPSDEIKVKLLPERLSQFGLTASSVANSIAQSNVDIPIGSVQTGGDVFTLRFAGRIENAQDLSNVAIQSNRGTPVLLSDIALIEEGFSDTNSVTRLGGYNIDSEEAVFIDIYKQSGEGDIISIVEEAKVAAAELEAKNLPEDVNITVTRDDGKLIESDINNLMFSGLQTVVIVVAVLMIFLGLREALLTSIVVPLTYLMTFIAIYYLGYTINFLTLFSLILALGILVDAGIVVVESMFEKMSKKGLTGAQAASETLTEFQMPLISGTLTTIFVFLPMLMMTGIMGKFIESIPVTITIVLLSAIIVALGFITTFATRFLHVNKGESEGGLKKVKAWIAVVYEWYEKKLGNLLNSKKSSKKFLYVIVAAFFITILFPVVGIVKLEMFPAEDMDSISITMENPVGTSLTETNLMTEEIEAVLSQDKRVKNFVTRVGSGSGSGSITSGGVNSHKAVFEVNLSEERKENSQEIIADFEEAFRDLVSADVTVGQVASGPEQGSPVQAKISSNSLEDLEDAARIIAEELEEISGTRNVETGIEESNGELVFEIDRAKATSFGVTELQVAQALRSAVTGTIGTTIHAGGDDVSVLVTSRLGEDSDIGSVNRVEINDLNSITVSTMKGEMPISSFGEIKIAGSRNSISHEDGERVITVSSQIVTGANVSLITKELQERIPNLELPDSVNVSFGGEAEDIQESFASLGQAMIVGIILILGLLIWQFKSYRQAFFIIITIPLALIGVFIGLAVTFQPLTFPGFIGIVALAGIVVNNAIILIDSINSDRKSGLDKLDAILKSAKSRLQPIILTTLTTVSGMLPLAISNPSWSPLAISIMAGLIFSTVLTLFVIPIIYLLFAENEIE